jgi:hypothetical protein
VGSRNGNEKRGEDGEESASYRHGATLARPPPAARHSVGVIREHLFVDNPNHKGNVAEAAIALAAMKLGLAVSKPMTEHARYDLVIETGEIDLVAVYCGELDRCYLLPERLFVSRKSVYLRLTPSRNGQRSCINLAAEYEFDGAVAQLARAIGWQPIGRGFESPQLHSNSPHHVGCDEFRIRLGHYVDLALAGAEIFVSRRGGKRLRFALAT